VWFDDPASLLPKYKVAVDAGLAGVGFWNLDCLAHGSPDPRERRQTGEMWAAVRDAFAGAAACGRGLSKVD
jgi:spore germination protein YaaH